MLDILEQRLRSVLQHLSEDDVDYKIYRGVAQLFRLMSEGFKLFQESNYSIETIDFVCQEIEKIKSNCRISDADLQDWSERSFDKLIIAENFYSGVPARSAYKELLGNRVIAFKQFLNTIEEVISSLGFILKGQNDLTVDPSKFIEEKIDFSVDNMLMHDIAYASGCLQMTGSKFRGWGTLIDRMPHYYSLFLTEPLISMSTEDFENFVKWLTQFRRSFNKFELFS